MGITTRCGTADRDYRRRGGACFHARRLLQVCQYEPELPPSDFGYIDLPYFLRYFAIDCTGKQVEDLCLQRSAILQDHAASEKAEW